MVGDEEAAERAYRARRRRRSAITLVVVLGLLGAAFFYAASYFRASEPEARPCMTVLPVTELRPADISVNVLNATKQQGLARGVAAILADRGFKVKSVANDPLDKAIKVPAELRHGPDGLESAQVLQKHLPAAVLVADKREGDTVDFVIGDGYGRMGTEPPQPTPTTVPCTEVTALQ